MAVVEARREVAAGYTVLHNRRGSWEAYRQHSLRGNVLNRLGAEGRDS